MNIHVSEEIIKKWPQFDFRGVPRKSRFGFTYIEVYYKALKWTMFYVFEADSFVDKEGIMYGAPELIWNKNLNN